MIQIEGHKRHVYIKFSEPSLMQEVLTSTKGQAEYRHTNGEISKVRTEAVDLGMRKLKIANLSLKSMRGISLFQYLYLFQLMHLLT
jgi:hypothetical protein